MLFDFLDKFKGKYGVSLDEFEADLDFHFTRYYYIKFFAIELLDYYKSIVDTISDTETKEIVNSYIKILSILVKYISDKDNEFYEFQGLTLEARQNILTSLLIKDADYTASCCALADYFDNRRKYDWKKILSDNDFEDFRRECINDVEDTLRRLVDGEMKEGFRQRLLSYKKTI